MHTCACIYGMHLHSLVLRHIGEYDIRGLVEEEGHAVEGDVVQVKGGGVVLLLLLNGMHRRLLGSLLGLVIILVLILIILVDSGALQQEQEEERDEATTLSGCQPSESDMHCTTGEGACACVCVAY